MMRASVRASRACGDRIHDQSLRLAELEHFPAEYAAHFGEAVTIRNQWTGPGSEGGPEFAVAIVAGALLRNAASDAYAIVRKLIISIYPRILARPAVRYYLDGALALTVRLDDSDQTVTYRFPADLDLAQLSAGLRAYEELARQEKLFQGAAGDDLCWSPHQNAWVPCPKPYDSQDDP